MNAILAYAPWLIFGFGLLIANAIYEYIMDR